MSHKGRWCNWQHTRLQSVRSRFKSLRARITILTHPRASLGTMQILKLVGSVLLALLLSTTSVQAVIAPVTPVSDQVVVKELTIKQKVDKYAALYKVSPSLMQGVVDCESSYNPKALGDNGHSRGIAQIHDLYHPEISNTQAYDPDFALDYLAKSISQGKGHEWTCYRKLTQ